jgi:hypothetical protein
MFSWEELTEKAFVFSRRSVDVVVEDEKAGRNGEEHARATTIDNARSKEVYLRVGKPTVGSWKPRLFILSANREFPS